jgi:probable HAF family extracellular repeat protein
VLWNNGVATDLHPQGSFDSQAVSINNLGQIVGFSRNAIDVDFHATLWNNGVAYELNPQDSFNSQAFSINDLGQIVGSSSNRPTLWNNGVATDLNSFLSASDQSEGWVLINAMDINDNGSIVGTAYNTVTTAQRGFLLQSVAAVPEVDTSAMLLMGLGLFGFMARRRKNTQA